MFSQVVSSPAQAPALLKVVENLPETFVSHAFSPDESPFAATLDWQPSRPDSFLPIAFNLALVHLSARAEGAVTTSRATAASAMRLTELDDMRFSLVGP